MHTILQAGARRLYSLALYCLSPWIWRRIWREHSPGVSRRQRLGRSPLPATDKATLWLHCASVGEILAARPLIEALVVHYPHYRLVVTTMTATGSERARSLLATLSALDETRDLHHAFLPLDFPGAARRFVSHVNPALAIFFETELWPNLFHACACRNVPVSVVNARLSPRAFGRYWRIRPLLNGALAHVDWLAAKSEVDAERFAQLGMRRDRITIVGSLKYDISIDDSIWGESKRLRTELGDRPVWLAGSTHPGEEAQLLDAHRRLLIHRPDALLVLVPRHPQRFDDVAALCRDQGTSMVRRSLGEWPSSDTRVYLADTMGELSTLYAAADIAFVGGSLVPIGGHNLLEPAALGVPVITGPYLDNFSDVASALRDAGALIDVDNTESLSSSLLRLFDDTAECDRRRTAGRRVVKANRGALKRILAGLEPLLKEPPP
ncbi:lipid IV(A) 3-deoxy-D-manno-octulosonic acid transferase [Aidingimonas lacisalsi]|uniref:lipid IV(A) 3-deoxy-D-manno-octulosonic acid transferase n=1 Tax=Aidingimonas lacisalsi TaxID=2604086 RepID=UPI0011D26069|nr:lipid IV(A) 3-deoxy-D-manno-octulosonic acid transferase [Aidingimonas lacisalsi]